MMRRLSFAAFGFAQERFALGGKDFVGHAGAKPSHARGSQHRKGLVGRKHRMVAENIPQYLALPSPELFMLLEPNGEIGLTQNRFYVRNTRTRQVITECLPHFNRVERTRLINDGGSYGLKLF
jgi:hypothetical protein